MNAHNDTNEGLKAIYPDEILIGPISGDEEKISNSSSQEQPSTPETPPHSRLLYFFAFISSFLMAVILFICALILSFLAAFQLFKNEELNRSIKSIWILFAHTLMMSLAMAVGVLNPSFGKYLISVCSTLIYSKK